MNPLVGRKGFYDSFPILIERKETHLSWDRTCTHLLSDTKKSYKYALINLNICALEGFLFKSISKISPNVAGKLKRQRLWEATVTYNGIGVSTKL